jgi:hypothetical protein
MLHLNETIELREALYILHHEGHEGHEELVVIAGV